MGMNRSKRMQIKAVVVLLGIMFLVVLVIAGIFLLPGKTGQPQGTYMSKNDSDILVDAVGLINIENNDEGDIAEKNTEEYVTFGSTLHIFENIVPLQDLLREFDKKYDNGHYMLKDDWYALYDAYLFAMELNERVNRVEVVSLGTGEELTDTSGNQMPENILLTEEKEYRFVSSEFVDYRFLPVCAYQKDGTLLTVYEQTGEEYKINNAWIMEVTEKGLLFFWNDYEVKIDCENNTNGGNFNIKNLTQMSENVREQVADISFEKGQVTEISPKLEKVSGKILGLDEFNITIEGSGVLPFSENLKIYQIYDKLVRKHTSDLRIGYNFTDFVIVDGKVEACLITRDEAMESIRVLINNSNYNGLFHDSVKATVDTDYVVRYGTYGEIQEQEFKAGDVVEFSIDSAYLSGDRIQIVPKALTGKVELVSVERSQGTPKYRGSIDIIKTSDGLVVINEVLLEEYLYCVVPSEMPASYPLEALKAQAVCARTYAYRNMLNSGLPAYGAHVDDSTSFQVYNNIKENVESTKAVRETKGQLIYSGDTLVDAYYYSTSCGFGTTAEIWKSGSPSPTYLQSKRIGSVGGDDYINVGTMMLEDSFKEYINDVYESDYDSSEGWYRWSYMVGEIDADAIVTRMQTRQKTNKRLVLKRSNDDEYVINEVESFSKIYNMICDSRLPGGVLDTLIIETDKGTYQVIGEYNIRYVLNNGKSKVCKQDGIEVDSPTLLPSAFFVMDVEKEGDCVTGYSITGGGYGHGVGMSQNGAKNMALKGIDSTGILTFFYEGSNVKTIY